MFLYKDNIKVVFFLQYVQPLQGPADTRRLQSKQGDKATKMQRATGSDRKRKKGPYFRIYLTLVMKRP